MKELEQGVYLITHKETNEQYLIVLYGLAPLLHVKTAINLTKLIYFNEVDLLDNTVLISLQHTDFEWTKLTSVGFPNFTEYITNPLDSIPKKIQDSIVEDSRKDCDGDIIELIANEYYLTKSIIRKIISNADKEPKYEKA